MNKPKMRTGILLTLAAFLWTGTALAESDPIRTMLRKGVEVNFSGDYDRAADIFSGISSIDPHHPSCSFYQAVVVFWKNSVAETDPAFVEKIRRHLKKSIAQSERMLSENRKDLDALHYLGLAYTYLGRVEAHHGSLYKGGVLGERGRKYLERAIEICALKECEHNTPGQPECLTCDDLYFPFGAYSYFAGRLPQFLKAINFLWFIPSGSTEEGLDALERAFENSDLHRLGAQSLLADIFLNFESRRIPSAGKLSDDLVTRFPDNPYLELQQAKILIASGRYLQADEKARQILEKAANNLRNYDLPVRQRALLIRAESAICRKETKAAADLLARLKNDARYQKNSLTPHTDLLLGMLADIEMNREQAARHYEKARAYSGMQKNRMVARKAGQYLKEPFTVSDRDAS